jgi:hypothetical protein
VHALRECARATPVREATADLLENLRISRQEEEPDRFAIQEAIETLLISEGIGFLAALKDLANSFPHDHPLVELLTHVHPETFTGQLFLDESPEVGPAWKSGDGD